MRKRIVTSMVFAATMLIGQFLIPSAHAITGSNLIGLAKVETANPVEDVAYVCRRVRRCGPYGCGWRRECWETGPGYGYGRGNYGGWNTWNGCPPNYTVQDGVCKPYRGY
jgi:hypothetical protein